MSPSAPPPNASPPYRLHRDPSWLVQSLTHVSVLGGVSYQRLEFLGDALMDIMVSLRLLASGHATQ
jgi:dsRNA-specific ribonuclease